MEQQSVGTAGPVEGTYGEPGWYPDPERPGEQRWWDGLRWAPRGMGGYRNALLDVPAAGATPQQPAAAQSPSAASGQPPRKRRLGKVATVVAAVAGAAIGLTVTNAAFDAWRNRDDTTVTSAPTRTPAAGDVRTKAGGVSLMLPAGWRALAVTPDQVVGMVAQARKNNPRLTPGLNQLQAAARNGYVVLYAARPSRVAHGWNSVNVQVVPRAGAHPSDVVPGLAGELRQIGASRVTAVETVASGRQAVRVTCLLTLRDGAGRSATQEEVQYYVFGPDKVAIITVSETRDAAGHATRVAADAAEMSAFVTFD